MAIPDKDDGNKVLDFIRAFGINTKGLIGFYMRIEPNDVVIIETKYQKFVTNDELEQATEIISENFALIKKKN